MWGNEIQQSRTNVDMWETSRSGLTLFRHSSFKNPETEVFQNIRKGKGNILSREYFRFDEFDQGKEKNQGKKYEGYTKTDIIHSEKICS